MKKMLTAVLSLSLLGAAVSPALAADLGPALTASAETEAAGPVRDENLGASGFAVEVDGEQINGYARVMVPLRAVAEKLGFTVSVENGVVTVTGTERYATLTIGEDRYFAAPTQEGMTGASLFSLGCAPYVNNGSTYVPAELFDALLGCKEGTVVLTEDAVKISTDPSALNHVQLPNPFTDHSTLTEAAKAAGFDLAVPENVNGNPRSGIQTMNGEMIQVFYGGEDNEVCIRKAPGDEDISGDYNSYAHITSEDVNGIHVTLKGENNLIHLALWTSGGYTYSIFARAGMIGDDMTSLIASVK